ncbi:protein transport protein Sec24C-like [Aphidius gifuensis]|uniref:protein transport protein Sec24C-like n=1 Tax=Aphidius gifuensis TaxID=684658 RepID=UPI001CDC7CE8|nr:protein transport protein Sec24C-like [Aphidius gifuensis]
MIILSTSITISHERPELMLGTYEFIATKDYCRNNEFPKTPAIIFLIDVSYNNIKSGLINLICSEMKNILKNLPKDTNGDLNKNMKVGFITYSNTVHFYNINSNLTQPQMLVVGDVHEIFMPLLDGFLCDANESEAVIDSLMTQIPLMFCDSRETETILAPAIQAGIEALKASDCPGKLIVLHSSLPIAEAPGKLKNRDDRKLLGTDKEKTILTSQNNIYEDIGKDCISVGCSVDLYLFNNSYIDIATIGQVCRLSGGQVFKYTYFQANNDADRLITDIINNISCPIGFDSVMRVRTSTGLRPTDFYGHLYMPNTTDMEIASIDCNKSIGVEIKHDDKLNDDDCVYIQVALLYTSSSGIRRIRIINLSLKTSSQIAELYRACDTDAVINFFSKQCVFELFKNTPKSIKDNLIKKCATILSAYRKHCASPLSASRLILPECMKLLPLYVNCILKNDVLSGGSEMTVDDKSYIIMAVTTMPVYTSVFYFYPRLLPLHDINIDDDKLPQQLRCSIDKFTDNGVFLLENGIQMFLWLGQELSAEWIQAVFGSHVVDTDRTTLPVLDNPLNQRIRDIIAQVRAERHLYMKLTIVRQRGKLEMVLRHFLVEDRSNDGSPGYVDFLCHMHKEIKQLLNQ